MPKEKFRPVEQIKEGVKIAAAVEKTRVSLDSAEDVNKTKPKRLAKKESAPIKDALLTFPKNEKEFQEKDAGYWKACQNEINNVSTAEDLIDYYNKLASIKGEPSFDPPSFDAFIIFLQALVKKACTSKEGLDFFQKELRKPSSEFGDVFYNPWLMNGDSFAEGSDLFRGCLLLGVLKSRAREAFDFAKDYWLKLIDLYNKDIEWREEACGAASDDDELGDNFFDENVTYPQRKVSPEALPKEEFEIFKKIREEYQKGRQEGNIFPSYLKNKMSKEEFFELEHGKIESEEEIKDEIQFYKNAVEEYLNGPQEGEGSRYAKESKENIEVMKKRLGYLEDKLAKKDFYTPEPYKNALNVMEAESSDFEYYPQSVSAILQGFLEGAEAKVTRAEDIDAIVNYIKEQTHFSVAHLPEIIKCFEAIDIAYATEQMLAIIRDPKSTPDLKRVGANILYRLEFGKIGISERGVEYLRRFYDLGEFNNPNYFTQRLTRNGEMGIFDDNNELIRYFELGDLSTPENIIKAKVLSFTYETLFTPKPNETQEERKEREEILVEFQQRYFKFFDNRFFQNTGLVFNNFSFKEQGQFMHFAERAEDSTREKALDFVRQYGEDGFRSFLSLEYGVEMGQIIFEIGKDDLERAKAIFREYSQIINFAEDFNKAVMPVIKEVAPGGFNGQEFFGSLMYSGKQFLDFCHSQIKENSKVKYDAILAEIIKEHPGLNPKNAAEGITAGAVIELVNQIGLEKTRDVFNNIYRDSQDENIKKHIDQALSFINPPDGQPVRRVDDLYQSMIKFEHYGYSTHDFEIAMLGKYTSDQQKTLDLGCGTGRLTSPLAEAGRDITALDYTGRHVKMVKEKIPQAKVLQGDWAKVGLADNSFDVIYSLGRNILHEYQLTRQQKLFAEANRILKLGGRFIVDIPDRTRGHYRKSVEAHQAIMRSRGIKNVREGIVYDSPDEQHYSTRYLYSSEDIQSLAESNGFEVEAIEQAELNNGYGDVNLYYILKKSRELPKKEKAKIIPDSAREPSERVA